MKIAPSELQRRIAELADQNLALIEENQKFQEALKEALVCNPK
jgi:hypothetical protein